MSASMIDFSKTFGARTGMTLASNNAKEERPKAMYWLNVGYLTGDDDYPFCALPAGIPLDTTEHLAIRGRNEKFNQFRAAQNNMLDQLVKAAAQLEPGQDVIIGGDDGGLAIQIRRVAEEAQAPNPENNGFLRDFGFKKVA